MAAKTTSILQEEETSSVSVQNILLFLNIDRYALFPNKRKYSNLPLKSTIKWQSNLFYYQVYWRIDNTLFYVASLSSSL